MNFAMGPAHHRVSRYGRASELLDSFPRGQSEFFLYPTLVTRRRNIFLYLLTELKSYHLSYFVS